MRRDVPLQAFLNNRDLKIVNSAWIAFLTNLPNVVAQTPSNSSAVGDMGTIAFDSSYIYICVAPNTWRRAGISAFF